MEKKLRKLSLALPILFTLAIISCAGLKVGKSLDNESKDFLSNVRYLITTEERQAFLKLPASERKQFIEDFWKRRDPMPETPVNEFKEEYFRRIKEANRLFSEGISAGWLSDRGRIWITLGPPDNREAYPRGASFYDVPREIWWYGFYPLLFVDYFWNGDYKLDPLSAEQVALISQSKAYLTRPGAQGSGGSRAMDIDIGMGRTEEGKYLIAISFPYDQIWFKAREDLFETTIEITLEISDSTGKKVWNFKKAYPFSLRLPELKENFGKDWITEIQAEFSGQSPFTLQVVVDNKVEQKKFEKKLRFEG